RRLRRRRLRHDRPDLRHARGLRSADRGDAPPRDAGDPRPGDEPHELGPSLVRGIAAQPERAIRRLVPVARWRPRSVRAAAPAEQLDVVLWRVGLDLGRGPWPVLYAHVPARATRRELAQPGAAYGHAGDGSPLARAG